MTSAAVDRAFYISTSAIALFLFFVEAIKVASLIHGLLWIFNPRARELREVAGEQIRQGVEVDWEWLERTKGHARLFDRRLKAIRPPFLRRLFHILYRAYVLVFIASLSILVAGELPNRWRPDYLLLGVAAGCLLVALLALLHEGFKWALWMDVRVEHWSNRLPGPFEQWAIGESKLGRMLANWMVLLFMGFFAFAAAYGALYAVAPGKLTTTGSLYNPDVFSWLGTAFSYGKVGLEINGGIGRKLLVLQIGWSIVAGAVPIFYGVRDNKG